MRHSQNARGETTPFSGADEWRKIHMKVGKYVTQKFLSARSDKDVDGKIFIIDGVFPEIINGVEKLCLRLKGLEKPLVLNQTNISTLSMAFGDDTDHWMNQKISLVIVTVMFNGSPTEGIQIKVVR